MQNSKRIWTGLLLMAVGLLGAVTAYAQSGPSTDLSQYIGATPSGDLSKQMWRNVLGNGFADNPFGYLGEATSLLGKLFIVFNGAIFAVGMARLGYGILSGIVGTAQDGQALGQRINTAWYPIRVITGISGLVPVLGGFTLSQGLLMSTASLGIGIANMMFNAGIDNSNLGLFKNGAFTSSTTHVNAQTLASNLLSMNICFNEYTNQEALAKAMDASPDPLSLIKRTLDDSSPSSVTIRIGTDTNKDLCGSVTVRKDGGEARSSTAVGFRVSSVNYAGIANGLNASVLTAHKGALNQLDSEMSQAAIAWNGDRTTANGIAAGQNLYLIASNGGRSYNANVDRTIAAIMSSADFNGINAMAVQNMKSQGWFGLGGWYSTFAEVNAAIADAAGSVSYAFIPPAIASPSLNSEVSGAVSSLDARLAADQLAASKATSASGEESGFSGVMREACGSGLIDIASGDQDSTIGTATGNCSMGQAIISRLIKATSVGSGGGGGSVIDPNTGTSLVNPVIGLKNVGDFMMTMSSTVFFGDSLGWLASKVMPGPTAAVAGVVGKISSVLPSGASEKAGGMLATIGMLFFVCGAYLSLYLPLIPFVIWVGAMVAYTASFIEGLIAMPLHSFSHLDTEGEGMGSSTSHGYLFFLNTLARPAIMVIAFFVASAIVIALGTIVTTMFMPAIANAQGNSITGVFSILGYVAIYGVVMSIVINSSFDLIHVLPDQVIGFVGSGNISTRLGQDTEGKINSLFMASARLGPQLKGPKPSGGGNANQSKTKS